MTYQIWLILEGIDDDGERVGEIQTSEIAHLIHAQDADKVFKALEAIGLTAMTINPVDEI